MTRNKTAKGKRAARRRNTGESTSFQSNGGTGSVDGEEPVPGDDAEFASPGQIPSTPSVEFCRSSKTLLPCCDSTANAAESMSSASPMSPDLSREETCTSLKNLSPRRQRPDGLIETTKRYSNSVEASLESAELPSRLSPKPIKELKRAPLERSIPSNDEAFNSPGELTSSFDCTAFSGRSAERRRPSHSAKIFKISSQTAKKSETPVEEVPMSDLERRSASRKDWETETNTLDAEDTPADLAQPPRRSTRPRLIGESSECPKRQKAEKIPPRKPKPRQWREKPNNDRAKRVKNMRGQKDKSNIDTSEPENDKKHYAEPSMLCRQCSAKLSDLKVTENEPGSKPSNTDNRPLERSKSKTPKVNKKPSELRPAKAKAGAGKTSAAVRAKGKLSQYKGKDSVGKGLPKGKSNVPKSKVAAAKGKDPALRAKDARRKTMAPTVCEHRGRTPSSRGPQTKSRLLEKKGRVTRAAMSRLKTELDDDGLDDEDNSDFIHARISRRGPDLVESPVVDRSNSHTSLIGRSKLFRWKN